LPPPAGGTARPVRAGVPPPLSGYPPARRLQPVVVPGGGEVGPPMAPRLPDLRRRDVVRGLGVGALLAVVAPSALRAAVRAPVPARPRGGGHFLTADELDTLRAVTGRLIP